MNMFDFLNMAPYEDRLVKNTEINGAVIDTTSVPDGVKPFETAVSHPEYKDDGWIIVEAYDTKEQAIRGHQEWVSIMSKEPLPEILKDCNNAGLSQLGLAVSEDWEERHTYRRIR